MEFIFTVVGFITLLCVLLVIITYSILLFLELLKQIIRKFDAIFFVATLSYSKMDNEWAVIKWLFGGELEVTMPSNKFIDVFVRYLRWLTR